MFGRVQLSEAIANAVHFYSEQVLLAQGAKVVPVTVTRTGQFADPRYGVFEITLDMLQNMLANFENNVYGQDIVLDLSHKPAEGAAGFFRSLSVEPYSQMIEGALVSGHKLVGQVELTEFGIEAITKRGFVYLSAEFHPDFSSNETGRKYGPVLLGAALTPRPVIKHLDRVSVQLSESSIFNQQPTFIDPTLACLLNEDRPMWKKLIEALQAHLGNLSLTEAVQTQLITLAEQLLSATTDETAAQAVIAALESTAKTLAEGSSGQAVTLSLPEGLSFGLSQADIDKQINDRLTALRQQEQDSVKALATLHQTFDDTVKAAEGLEEDDIKVLSEARSMIHAGMTADQVKRLATHELKSINRLIAARKLAEQGVSVNSPSGVVTLGMNRGNDAAQLQEIQHNALKKTRSYQNKELRLSESVSPFVSDTLAVFDSLNAHKIHHAVRTLADGQTGMVDTDLPVGYQREVIREALSDLRILELVATATDPAASVVTQIPYEERDVANVKNGGIVSERQPIPKAGVKQMMDMAYINAMKISIDVSNEVMHFTRTSGINWDAWARNISSAARLMRELLAMRLANMIQRSADAYNAVAVADEDISGQVDGGGGLVKTAAFPIVAPHQIYDLQGNAVGNPTNPITLKVNGTEIAMFDGTGSQANGTYYVIENHNLGYIRFVDQAGDPAAPNHSSGATTISYSRAGNILLVDSDKPAELSRERHLNKLLQAFGSVKSTMSAQRFVQPDFALMSASLHNEVTDAELFSANSKRPDADINSQGDLQPVKGVSAYSTNAPNIHLGDERIILGQTNVASYTIAKPFMFGEMQEARDSNGRLIGAKEAYGEEYNALHVPKPLQGRFMSILWYSATNR